jgi:hypothetical protein
MQQLNKCVYVSSTHPNTIAIGTAARDKLAWQCRPRIIHSLAVSAALTTTDPQQIVTSLSYSKK